MCENKFNFNVMKLSKQKQSKQSPVFIRMKHLTQVILIHHAMNGEYIRTLRLASAQAPKPTNIITINLIEAMAY